MIPGSRPLPRGLVFAVAIVANQTDYNLTTALTALGWDGRTQCEVLVSISSGVTISSTNKSSISASDPSGAFNFGGTFAPGSQIEIVNAGKIIGYGGNGGAGGGANGAYGGHAIYMPTSLGALVRITNASGDIWGGGGGGAGEAGIGGGGGGGGGAGSVAGAGGAAGGGGGAGSAGTSAQLGGGAAGGSGGAGGNMGAAGASSAHDVGGPAGFAIFLNGNTSPTFVSGSGSPNVLGSVA